MTKLDWMANIDSLAVSVADAFGENVVASVFERYGAKCSEDLNPSCYEAVFSDLMVMDADI